jgi:hypothetical protein
MNKGSFGVQTVTELGTMPDEFEKVFRQVPRNLWNWKPESWDGVPGESFSALEQACHLRDIEIDGYHVRFQRMLREDNPALESIDGYALARERKYEEQAPDAVLAEFRSARARTIEMLSDLTDAAWRRKGSFAEYGILTTAGLAHLLRSHDQQHLACMQWLFAKASAR